MIYTTLALLKAHSPCESGWQKLLASLTPKQRGQVDRRIPLTHILKSNGLQDCLWALRAGTDQTKADKLARLFAVKCAERVLPIFEKAYPSDKRPRVAIETAYRFAMGRATKEELAAAGAAAWAAAGDAAGAAAWAAAGAAAWAAAGAAAWAAAGDAAWAAEKKWQAKTLKQMLGTSKRK